MKIFIPSYGRANTICTHHLLDGLDWKVLVHDLPEFVEYAKYIPEDHLLMSDQELGIAKQRNWILDELVEDGEWFVMMDDNIKQFLRVHPDLYEKETLPTDSFNGAFWKPRFNVPCLPGILEAILEETRRKAEQVGANLAGLATTGNHFFRASKWRTSGFVCTKTAIVKKTDLRFDERFYAKDDVDFSAQNMDRYGRVLVNNFLYPKAAHHQVGGIGNKTARKSYSARETILLTEKWPFLSLSKTRESEVIFHQPKEIVK